MYPFATDLVEGDRLPEEDEIARYCSPGVWEKETHEPKVTAFMRKQDEDDLSVNRLQFYRGQSRPGAVDCIRDEMGTDYDLKKNGKFVVFSVSEAKAAALNKGCRIDVVYTPKTSRPSHSSIFGLPEPEDYEGKVRVATALARLIKMDDIYEAVVL